ncbi:WHG domain-containing protein [Archangium violaceum]|nr:WHG domain-containing protein [Archangium violaceum]
MRFWTRLHGLLSLELLGHFAVMGIDPALLYTAEVDALLGGEEPPRVFGTSSGQGRGTEAVRTGRTWGSRVCGAARWPWDASPRESSRHE